MDCVEWSGSAPPPPPPPPSPLAEALDSDLSYTTVGEGNFVKSSDPFYFDGDAAESIAVSHGEQAWLKTTVDANSGDKVSFYWKVSSEQNGDYLKFRVDDDVKYQISGDVDWQPKTYTITSTGPHTLEWRFIRDSSGDGGDNCGWVDFVQWTQPSPTQDPDHWNTIKYKYDPSGRRVEKNVDGYKTRYIYTETHASNRRDGGNVIAEYDGNGNLTRKYIHGARVDELVCMIDVADSSAVYYYHYDGLGSVVALSNSSGDSCQSYEYSAFGQVAASDPNFTANPYMFTGRRFDYETGLYYYRARYYNPYIGRFMQTDPVGYSAGMNLYAYCGNNPIVFIDPSGLVAASTSLLMFELYDIFDTNDLWFVYDDNDIWVVSEFDDVYDFGDDDPLIVSEDDGELELIEAGSNRYVPGLPEEEWEEFWRWWHREGKKKHGLKGKDHPKGEKLEEYGQEWKDLGKPKGSKPKGWKHRLQDMGDQVFKTVVTAWAETLEMLPSDEALHTGAKISLGFSAGTAGVAGAIVFGPSILPWLAGAAGTAQPALSH